MERIARRDFFKKSAKFLTALTLTSQRRQEGDGLLCRGNIDELINCAASYMSISPERAHGIVECESEHKPDAYNRSSGASGLWQITPINAHLFREQGWNYPEDAFDPERSTTIAIMIFREQGIIAWSCAR